MTVKLIKIRCISGRDYYAEWDKRKYLYSDDYPYIEVYLDNNLKHPVTLKTDKIESIENYTKYVPSVEDMND